MIEQDRPLVDILLKFREVLARLDCEGPAPLPSCGSQDGPVRPWAAPAMHLDQLAVSGAAEAADAAL